MPDLHIRVTADTQQAQANLKGFSGTFTEIKAKLDLVAQGAKIVGGVLKTALDLTSEGAKLKDTTDSLERLTRAAGYGGDIIEDLGKAFNGTVDDADFMASTIRLLTGETGEFANALASAAPQLAIIARAAVKLNPTLGTTAEAYEAITRAIETGQTRALKNYGIILEDTENKQDALNQILEQGGTLIEQVGGNVDTASDPLDRFTQLIDDAKDAVTLFLAEGLLPIAEGLLSVIEALNLQGEAAKTAGLTFKEYADSIGIFGAVLETVNLLTGNSIAQNYEQAAALEAANQAALAYGQTEADLASRLTESNDEQATQVTTLFELMQAYESAGQGSSEYAEKLEANEAAAATLNKALEEEAKALADVQARADEINLEELNDQLSQDLGSPLTAFIEDLKFMIASGGQDFIAAFEAIKQALANSEITAEEAAGFSAELLASVKSVEVAAGQIDLSAAGQELADTLNIPLAEAITLIETAGTALDTELGVERAVLINSGRLDEVQTQLDEIGDTSLELEYDTATATQNVEYFKLAVEGLEGSEDAIEPLGTGLGVVESAAYAAASAVKALQAAINAVDTGNLDAFIAESPPPLGEGLQIIANIIPSVVSGFNHLGTAFGNIGSGRLDLEELFENLKEDAEEFADALFDAAGAFEGLGNAAAGIFEKETLDPLKAQLELLDAEFDELIKGPLDEEAANRLNGLSKERAELAAEIAAQEERILKLQEQQQKLDFLSQQFELIKFLQENGIDPSSVLGGIDLGANADPAALIEAMSNALEQILLKLGDTLGGLGFAGGANFVVPPGYPGDSFGPMWASSGEHVSVTHGGEMGGRGGTNITISMAGAIIMSQQEADRLMRNALDRTGLQADIYRRGG